MSNKYVTKGKRLSILFLYAISTILLIGCKSSTNKIDDNVTNNVSTTPIVISEDNEVGKNDDTNKVHTDYNKGITDENEKNTILSNLLDSWNFDYASINLEQVIDELDKNRIHYAGYYNVSRERIDIVLEDKTHLIFLEVNDPEKDYWERTNRYQLIMKGDTFNGNAFQEMYLNEYDVTSNEYMFPNLSDKDLDPDMLFVCNQTDLSIARNQLFAKYGRKFTDPFLSAVFSRKDWYDPRIDGETFDKEINKKLTEIEKKNLQLVLDIEENQYYRKSGDYGTIAGILSGSWLDLDGDGQVEQIHYVKEIASAISRKELITIIIKSEGGNIIDSIKKEVFNGRDYLYISSIEDGTYQLIIADDGPSADYSMEFYTFNNNKINVIGTIRSYPECAQITSGTISALVETYHIQCEPIRFSYVIENKNIRWIEQDYYSYRGNEVTALVELNLYENKGDTTHTSILNNGDRIIILGGNLRDWVQIKNGTTGVRYWIRVEAGKCVLSDGTKLENSQCFDGLTFYG